MKHVLCKLCNKNFKKPEGFSSRYCSLMCHDSDKRRKKCEPKCSEDGLFVEEVQFKDNSRHLRQKCRNCKVTRYVQKPGTKEKKITARIIYGHFYKTPQWLQLRYQIIKKYGRNCSACGITAGEFHVDHIKPKSLYPELAYDPDNLQVLCRDCNLGKSNTDDTDWR